MRVIETRFATQSGSARDDLGGRLRVAERREIVQAGADGRGRCVLSVPGMQRGGGVATIARASQGTAPAGVRLTRCKHRVASAEMMPGHPGLTCLEEVPA